MTDPSIGYPVISIENALRLGSFYQKQIDASTVPLRQLSTPKVLTDFYRLQPMGGVTFDWDQLEELASDFFTRTRKLKYSEAQTEMATTLREIVQLFPPLVVQDLDFWRYLSLVTFRNFVFKFKNRMAPVDFLGSNSQVERARLIEPLRMACRLAEEANDPYLTIISDVSTREGLSSDVRDSYISNIIRPEWAKHGKVGRAFIDAALAEPPVLDDGRKGTTKADRKMNLFQSRVSALQNNVLFPYLDQSEAAELFLTVKEI